MSRKGKLKSEHEQAIRVNYIYLQEELDPVSVAYYLHEKGIINEDELEEIQSCKTRKQKATELIDKILHAGPQPHDAFEIFLQSLEKVQKHIQYRLIKSTQDWFRNGRCPSPQNVPKDTPDNEPSDRLLQELDNLNKEIDNLMKENEQLTKENKKLSQSLANEIQERKKLADFNCHLLRMNVPGNGQRCCEHCTDACKRIKCIFCDSNVQHKNVMQFESELDESLEKILKLVLIDPKNSVWQEFFLIVACANMVKSLNVLLNQGMEVDLNATLTRNVFIFQSSKLHRSPNTRSVQKLVPYQYNKQLTALMAAASNGSYRSLKLLLENGADVNATDVLGDTPLIYLCRGMHIGHPLYHTSENWNNSLSNCLNALISSGARIDAKGEGGMTALMHCAKNGNKIFCSTLLDKVPDMSIVCDEGKTVLMYACSHHTFYERFSPINMIISKNKCDVNARDKNGNTALMHCLLARNVDSFYELFGSIADVNIQNNEGVSPLILAVKLNMEDVVKEFLKYYSDNNLPLNLNLQDKNGDTALITASKMSTSLAVELLDREGIDVNVQNNIGETALTIAAEKFENDLVEKLIVSGANVNKRDNEGRSILNRTRTSKETFYLFKSPETIQILIHAGAVD